MTSIIEHSHEECFLGISRETATKFFSPITTFIFPPNILLKIQGTKNMRVPCIVLYFPLFVNIFYSFAAVSNDVSPCSCISSHSSFDINVCLGFEPS